MKSVVERASPSSVELEIGESIRRAGVRLSESRRAIIDALVDAGDHVSVDDLARSLRARGLRVSLSTVYRAMRILMRLGIAREIRIGDTSHFELAVGREEHAHLVCDACGGISELHDPRLDDAVREIAEANRFRWPARIEIRATCAACVRDEVRADNENDFQSLKR
ncbi:MAG: transcriptional repressor [Labilithrix sp.]|nr:transcriptional repressor [Labilithrix sp.]